MKQYFKWIAARSLDMANITRVDKLAYKDRLLVSGLTCLTIGSYISSVRRYYE